MKNSFRPKKMMKKIGILFLCSTIITGSFKVYSSASQIDKAKQEKQTLEEKKADTELKIKELEADKSDILKYIEKLDKELGNLAEEISALETDISNTEIELENAREELDAAKIVEAEQYDIMKKRIKYMYENGESGYLDIILQSQSISDILNHVEYISKITEYDNGLLDKYTKIKEDITQKEIEINDKLSTLNELKEELDYEKSTVERLAEDKNKELVKYQQNIDDNMVISSEYGSQIDEQQQLIEDLIEEQRKAEEERKRKEEEERKRKEEEEKKKKEEEARKQKEEEQRKKEEANKNSQSSNSNSNSSDSNSSSSESSTSTSRPSSNGYIWPVPASSRITSNFGGRTSPTAGASSYHKGIDIGAPTGTSIIAAASGRVVTSTYQVAAGNYLMIAHNDGTYTVYMHCSKILVSVGDNVSQGQQIALVGSTGVSTGPHLHFGVMVNGQYVNPLNYVSY